MLEALGRRIEILLKGEAIHCYVENNKLLASFDTRNGLEIEVLTPFEIKLLEQGKYTDDDVKRKALELKQIANFTL